MAWERIEAPQIVKTFLENVIQVNRVAHAYLFTGRAASKRDVAIQFAKSLNCEKSSGDSCDQCSNCRQIDQGNSLEILEVSPDGSSIKIDQVRAVQKQFSLTPRSGTRRVVIFHQAELLTQPAANSLLKFLEEPVSPMIALLLCTNEQSILPTIRSRCQVVRFPIFPVSRNLSDRWRELGMPDWQIELLNRLPSQQETETQIMEKEEFAPLIEQVIKWNWEILSHKAEALLFLYQEPIASLVQNGQSAMLLDLLMLWQRELCWANQFGEEACFSLFHPWREEVMNQAYIRELSSLLASMEKLMEARHNLGKPMQDQAILEQMVLAVQEG